MAGFDNDPVAPHLHPSLTSVDTFMARVGAEALHILLAKIEDPSRAPVTSLIKPGFYVRESTSQWVRTATDPGA